MDGRFKSKVSFNKNPQQLEMYGRQGNIYQGYNQVYQVNGNQGYNQGYQVYLNLGGYGGQGNISQVDNPGYQQIVKVNQGGYVGQQSQNYSYNLNKSGLEGREKVDDCQRSQQYKKYSNYLYQYRLNSKKGDSGKDSTDDSCSSGNKNCCYSSNNYRSNSSQFCSEKSCEYGCAKCIGQTCVHVFCICLVQVLCSIICGPK